MSRNTSRLVCLQVDQDISRSCGCSDRSGGGEGCTRGGQVRGEGAARRRHANGCLVSLNPSLSLVGLQIRKWLKALHTSPASSRSVALHHVMSIGPATPGFVGGGYGVCSALFSNLIFNPPVNSVKRLNLIELHYPTTLGDR